MKICYVFTSGRRERLDLGADFPDDLFYGYTKIKYDKKIVQQSDFKEWLPVTKIFHTIISKIFYLFNLNYTFLRTIVKNRSLFDDANIIFLTTNGQGVHFAFLKIIGFFRGKKILFIPMGLYSKARKVPFLGKLLYPIYFYQTQLICISKGEEALLRQKLTFSKVTFCLFGVDAKYWSAGKTEKPDNCKRPYIMSIGNDQNRDYELLLKAWKPELPELKIITSLPLKNKLAANVEVLKGNWMSNLITDAEIREYYRNALFVVIPLKETIQPSGQSVALQAMACGKAVILTNTNGLWEKKYMKHNEVCYLISPNNVEELEKAVDYFMKYPQEAKRIGANARRLIETRYNTKYFAAGLQTIIESCP